MSTNQDPAQQPDSAAAVAPEELSRLAAAAQAEESAAAAAAPQMAAAPAIPAGKIEETAAMIMMIGKPTLLVLAPNWQIPDAQLQGLSEAYAQVVCKYFPEMNMGVEMQALLATVLVFGPMIVSKTPPRLPPIRRETVNESAKD